MDVFDFSNPQTRKVFIETCINATRTGYVDGCFLDRAVDGTPCDGDGGDTQCTGTKYNLKIAPKKLQEYGKGAGVLVSCSHFRKAGTRVRNCIFPFNFDGSCAMKTAQSLLE
jgi:hypothetical protein